MRHLPSIRASSPPLLHSLRHTGDFRSKLSVLWTKEATIIGLTAARERSLLLDTLSSPSSRRLQWDRFPPFFSPRTRLERRQEFSQRLRLLSSLASSRGRIFFFLFFFSFFDFTRLSSRPPLMSSPRHLVNLIQGEDPSPLPPLVFRVEINLSRNTLISPLVNVGEEFLTLVAYRSRVSNVKVMCYILSSKLKIKKERERNGWTFYFKLSTIFQDISSKIEEAKKFLFLLRQANSGIDRFKEDTCICVGLINSSLRETIQRNVF